MKRSSITCIVLVFFNAVWGQKATFRISSDQYLPEITAIGTAILSPPSEGLWSIATAWDQSWPAQWHHASPTVYEQSGDWQILKGELSLPGGNFKIRDAYRNEKGLIRCVRRFEWTGKGDIDSITLSVRWIVPGKKLQPFLPGILYYGNPSGGKNTPNCVVRYTGAEGEMAIFEDHRFPMPFICLKYIVWE